MVAESYRIERYRRTRLFALYDAQGALIAVTTYKKGARAVQDRLEERDRQLAECQARFNALASLPVGPVPEAPLPAPAPHGTQSPEDGAMLWSLP